MGNNCIKEKRKSILNERHESYLKILNENKRQFFFNEDLHIFSINRYRHNSWKKTIIADLQDDSLKDCEWKNDIIDYLKNNGFLEVTFQTKIFYKLFALFLINQICIIRQIFQKKCTEI